MTVAIISMLALIAVVFVVGLLLPKERIFVKAATLKSSPQKIFQLVTEVQHQATWRSDIQTIQIIDENTWTEVPKKGTPITFRTKQKIDNQLFEIEIIAPKNFTGTWIGTFEGTPQGTKIVFKEVITIENPFFRVLSSIFVDLDKTMEIYIADLKAKLGES
ncbi:MAG: hypothetical protein ACOVQA_06580 [Thermoflexibacteraceae bacterium]